MSRSMFAAMLLAAVSLCGCKAKLATNVQFSPSPQEPHAAEESVAVLVVENERFRLFYPEPFGELVPLETIVEQVINGMAHVEDALGKFSQQIDIYIALRIVSGDESFPEELTIQGVTFEKDGRITVVISLIDGDPGTYPHEFTHARLRDLKMNPPRWLEEGIAHFNETFDGLNMELYGVLQREGALTIEELSKDSGVDSVEMRRRATGWAVAYYLLKIEGHDIDNILRSTSLPEPKIAATAVHQAVTASSGN